MESTNRVEPEFLGDYKIICPLRDYFWSKDVLAEHRLVKKRVVLKILSEQVTESEIFMNDFHQTIIRLAALSHPHLLPIENVSQIEGKYFIVIAQKYSHTLSLAQYLSRSTTILSEQLIVTLISQLAATLDYAHEHDLIHGGLNLHSVFIDASSDTPKILLPEVGFSFFLKQRLVEETFRERKLEQLKELLFFETPEEPSNSIQNDVYAFGVIAYYLLFKTYPQGCFPMPNQAFPNHTYDWDKLLKACLTPLPQARATRLSPLLSKKSPSIQLQNALHACEEPLRIITNEPESPMLPTPQSLLQHEEQILDQATEQPEFVLVAAKSIDEAMDTTISDSQETCQESDSYSQALQTLLVREPVVNKYVKESEQTIKPQPLFTEMMFIPGGEFFRGNRDYQRDEYPVHKISLPGFFLDIHPVTNEQFVRFLDFVGSEQDAHCNELIRLKDSRIQRRSGKLIIEPGYAKHPVVGITWYGAYGYANWVGKRLPTEAEWEIAAYGGIQGLYPCGNNIDKTQANFFSADTTTVMSYPANAYGLYDMAGNVYEWCSDWYGYDFYETSAQEPNNPKGPAQGVYRVLRGGCWKSLRDDLRCAHRHRNNPGAVNSTYGFRCAKDV